MKIIKGNLFMFDIITFGTATQDILVKPKNLTALKYKKTTLTEAQVCFALGSKIDIHDMKFYVGGGATNVAATFSLQGFKTAFCGMIGKDLAGEKIIKELKNLKINTDLVLKTDKKLTSHAIIILNEEKDRTILVYRGASELLDKKNIPWNKLKTKWIYLAPLSGLLCDSFESLVDFAKENKIKVAVNPGIAQLSLTNFSKIAGKIDILILNQEEASFLTKISIDNEKEIFASIDKMCPGVTVMTKGAEGVLVSGGKFIYSAKPHSARIVIDTTGAGDSFASGFVTEFINTDGDIEKSIQLGMANSESCLSKIGAKNGLLKKGQKFKKIKITKKLI